MSANPSYVARNRTINKYFVAIGYVLSALLVLVMGGLLLLVAAASTVVHFGAPLWIGQLLGVVLALALVVFTTVFAMRDYRKNVSGQLTLDRQQLAIPTLRGQLEIPLDEIDSLRFHKDGHHLRIAIRTIDGKRYVLPKWFSQTENLAEVLQRTIVPSIGERWMTAIQAGAEIELAENRVVACGRVVFGFFMSLVAIGFILSIKMVGTGLSLFRESRESFYTGGGGMLGRLRLDARGIRRGNSRLAWDEIKRFEADDFGAVIETVEGRTWRISTYIDNFLPLHLVVSSLMQSTKP